MIIVDRIEGERAVLEADGELVELSRSLLPPDVHEGDVLSLIRSTGTKALMDAAKARLRRLEARHSLPDDVEL